MNNMLTFGQFEGKTLEWLFFHAPWYVRFIRRKGIQRQRNQFSEAQEDYFDELFFRATHLTGSCRYCNERRFTYMGLSTHVSGTLGHIGFYCDECDYTGGSTTGYYKPSFFMPYEAPRCEQLRLTEFIKNRYLASGGNLTQKKMEDFFHNDANFVHATPSFFVKQLVAS